MLQTIDNLLLKAHIIIGAISLIAFLIPLFLKKGGEWHVKIGWIYVYTMWFVVITAFILSIINIFQGHYLAALFLGFLSVITASPLWQGIAVLKNKKEVSERYLRISKYWAIAVFILSVANLTAAFMYGFKGMSNLSLIFGIIGLVASADLWKSETKLIESTKWYTEHLSSMIIAGMAAYTAFFAFGGRAFLGDIFSGSLMVIPWVAPTLIGVVLIQLYKRKILK